MGKHALQKVRGIPLYARIATSLRARLERGEWEVGARLPSIESLAGSFEVAPLTMRQALVVLENDGLIERRQGYGTVVTAEPRDLRWLAVPTDWSSLLATARDVEKIDVLEEVESDHPQDLPDGAKPVGNYHFLKRVHYRADAPFCLADMHLCSDLFGRDPEGFRDKIAIDLIDRMGDVRVGHVFQRLRIDVAGEEGARLLSIPLGSAVAELRRTICEEGGRVLYHAELTYPGDLIRLDLDFATA